MNKRILLLPALLILLFIIPVLSQGSEIYKISPAFKLNDKKKYKITKKIESDNKNVEINFIVTISLIKQLEDGFILKWDYDKVESSENNYNSIIIDYFKKSSPEYKIDFSGNFIGFVDFKKTKDDFNKFIDKMINNEKSNYKKEKLKYTINNFMENDDKLISLLNKDILLFHNMDLYNKELDIDNAFSYYTGIPNLWGNEPFYGMLNYKLNKISDNKVEIIINRELDREKSVANIMNILNSAIKDDKKSNNTKILDLLKGIEINEEFIYIVYDFDPWFESIEYTKILKLQEIEEKESTIFSLEK
jgi:hypothetical protein